MVCASAFSPRSRTTSLSAAALGVYATSAVKDWSQRRHMRWIDFEAEFGADVHTLESMPMDARREEVD